ncbi:hypothetical protein [Pararhizobium sp. PWRC1-1]|uniref:hypothetical protein n=1 Tax=Pararhizobium sp. PWRC1-1 TaxID=2804566 RepID=UPI003CF6E8A0
MTHPETNAAELAANYVKLGGTRRGKLDDNIIETRKWEDEPREASVFWRDQIETLSDDKRREVETNLPTMNSE